MEVLEKYNTRQAATYLKESHNVPATKGTLEVWRCLGRGPRYRKVARWVVYDRADLDKFAAGQIYETTDSAVA